MLLFSDVDRHADNEVAFIAQSARRHRGVSASSCGASSDGGSSSGIRLVS
jgi:hypothetical protein